MNKEPGRERKLKRLNLIIISVILLAAVTAVYFAAFHNSDRLEIADGKIKGMKPTWLTGHFAVNGGEEAYYKIADVSTPQGYKE